MHMLDARMPVYKLCWRCLGSTDIGACFVRSGTKAEFMRAQRQLAHAAPMITSDSAMTGGDVRKHQWESVPGAPGREFDPENRPPR